MKFQQTLVLLGVVGKKGTGKLDNGETWSTDRIELHVLSAFDESDSMSHGQTATVYQIQDYASNYEKAKSCLDQNIIVDFEMIPAKKLGGAPKLVALSFKPADKNIKA